MNHLTEKVRNGAKSNMAEKRDGTLYVGDTLLIPADFWGSDYTQQYREEHDGHDGLLHTVRNHRPGDQTCTWPEEWCVGDVNGAESYIDRDSMTKWIEEGHLVGASFVVVFAFAHVCSAQNTQLMLTHIRTCGHD